MTRDRGEFIREHTRAALNFHLTLLIALVAGVILTFVVVGIFVLVAAQIVAIIFANLAAVAANGGQVYKFPISIEFIK